MTGVLDPDAPSELRVTVTAGEDKAAHSVLIRRPASAPVSVAVVQLVDALRARGLHGVDSADYVLRSDTRDRLLDQSATLVSEGVRDGDSLHLIARTDKAGESSASSTVDGAPQAVPARVLTPLETRPPRAPRRRGRTYAIGFALVLAA